MRFQRSNLKTLTRARSPRARSLPPKTPRGLRPALWPLIWLAWAAVSPVRAQFLGDAAPAVDAGVGAGPAAAPTGIAPALALPASLEFPLSGSLSGPAPAVGISPAPRPLSAGEAPTAKIAAGVAPQPGPTPAVAKLHSRGQPAQPVPGALRLPASVVPVHDGDNSAPRAPVPAGDGNKRSTENLSPDGGLEPDGPLSTDGESASASASASFDQSSPKSRSLWARLRARIPFAPRERWPGRAGEKVRVGGRAYVLERPLESGPERSRWISERDYVVELVAPSPGARARARAEIAALRALRASDVPHAALRGADEDGSALVRDHIDGRPAERLLRQGLSDSQRDGWVELAARLIRAGAAPDLSERNLTWQHWRTRWVPLDVAGLQAARPGAIVARLLTEPARRAGVDPAEFLSGLRGRLGPDSKAWEETLGDLRGDARLAALLAALADYDRRRPPAPPVAFGPAAAAAEFPDRLGKPGEAAKALGYDPLTARPRRNLHLDDPGKLNTLILAVEPPGRTPSVVKRAGADIVKSELAVRRVVRRWFGRYFDVPSAVGVERGGDSYLVMEFKAGHPSWGGAGMKPEQRAALAVLANAFGLYDMNPGNILYAAGDRPVLLDFEQAFGRRAPNPGRIPDETIAAEMPWLSRDEVNRIEDYQPAIRAWRALLARPAARAALLEDFKAAGYSPAEAGRLLAIVDANTADLDWSIQVDADFVNQFARRKAEAPR